MDFHARTSAWYHSLDDEQRAAAVRLVGKELPTWIIVSLSSYGIEAVAVEMRDGDRTHQAMLFPTAVMERLRVESSPSPMPHAKTPLVAIRSASAAPRPAGPTVRYNVPWGRQNPLTG